MYIYIRILIVIIVNTLQLLFRTRASHNLRVLSPHVEVR